MHYQVNDKKNGNFLWIMGMAGVGKTTIAEKIYNNLRRQNEIVIWLDGDTLREALNISGHSLSERREAGLKYLGIASILTGQGVNVILSSIGMQQIFQKIGKKLIPNYFQILVKVDSSDLKSLGSRNFYYNGEMNVMGKDLKIESLEYDLIYENKFTTDDELIIRQCSNLLIYGMVEK
jgi:adenylylsulfate kinase-like enzyme